MLVCQKAGGFILFRVCVCVCVYACVFVFFSNSHYECNLISLKKKKNNLFIFGCPGSSLLHRIFSRRREQGLPSSCSAQVSYCVASLIVEHGL